MPGYLSCGEIPAVELSGTTASGNEKDFSGSDVVSQWYRYGVSGNSDQVVVTHTFMYNSKQLRNYTILYDKTKKAALWAACPMHSTAYPWVVSRSDSWQYDPAIEQSWQPKLSSSYSGGYTRGHQVASNDRRTTLYQMYQTDYFSNMTPQTSEFNAGSSTDWDELEGNIQELGKSITGRDTLYVVTGAIFGSGYKTDAKDNNNVACPVPTDYYKCIMKVSFNTSGEPVSATGAAFLVNHDSMTQQNKTINQMETLTGFTFFANLPSSVTSSAKNTFTSFF